MQLDNITIAIRPRHHREAMDLGLRLVQSHWRVLYRSLLAFILPLFVLLNLVFHDTMWLPPLIVWWLKPLYDRLILHVLSRELFGETPTVADTLRQIPAMFRSGLLWQLTLLRFMPTRSFALPLWQLEGLRGRRRRERSRLLANRAWGHAVWLMVVCWHMEAFFSLALFGLLFMLLPANVGFESYMEFFANDNLLWIQWLTNTLYLLPMLAVEPFYVAGGFMLYINRRTELEAWDIEIGLRRLGRRLQELATGAAALLLLLAGLAGLPAEQAWADTGTRLPASESRRVIDEVLADEAFNTEQTMTLWLPASWLDDDEEPAEDFQLPNFAPWLAQLLKLLVILTLLGALIYLLVRYGHLLPRPGGRRQPLQSPPPTALFGMDIQPESLPDDIATEARRLWQAGEHRQALGLLYRGSLSRLVNRDHLPLHDSMTEADIMQAVRQAALPADKTGYLDSLTRAWLQLAYGHRHLNEATVQPLFAHWSAHFDREAADEP